MSSQGLGHNFKTSPSGLLVPSSVWNSTLKAADVTLEMVGPADTTKFLRGDNPPTWAVPSGGTPSGPAGGDLAGTYPNPTLAVIGSAATVGSTSAIPVVTVNTKGLVTALSSASPQIDTVGAGTDITTNNVSTTKHGLTPKAPNDATKFLDGTAAYDTVKDSDLSTSDITTNDVTTAKHGFTPKAPNDAAKFLRGDATWATVGGSGGGVVGNDAIWDAKGDLAAATGPDAAVAVTVGANNTVLTADSAQTAGIKWASSSRELGYAEITASVNLGSTSESAPTLIVALGSLTYAATPTLIEFFAPRVAVIGGKYLLLNLWDGVPGAGGTNLGYIGGRDARAGSATVEGVTVHAVRRLTPSAASHTYGIYAWMIVGTTTGNLVGAGAGGAGDFLAAFVRASLA